MNPYLKAQREKYAALVASIEGLQTRAAEANRDLTEDELRSAQTQGDQAKKMADEIESLTEIETRSRKVAEVSHSLSSDQNTEVRTGTTQTRDRDPGHYRSEKQGGQHSFFTDLVRSKENDDDARLRLVEHHRALSSASAGSGILPPKWLSDEYADLARQGRRVADAVRHLPLSDTRPITLPKQTAGATVVNQSAENIANTWTDAFNTGTDTMTPVTVIGGQKVSRQLLDASSPAIDVLIWGDLMANYNTNVEAKVVTSMVTAAGTAVTAYLTEAAWTTAVGNRQIVGDTLKLQVAVRNARKLPADILVMSVTRYGDYLSLIDNQGRPLVPLESNGPMNVFGTGSVAVDGRFQGLGIIATDGITQYPESILAARASDTLLFESPTMRFRADEPDGPETVRLAVWGYVGVLTRYAGQSVKRNQITGA